MKVAIILGCLMPAIADLPVHCVRDTLLGEWTFHKSKANKDKGEACVSGEGMNVCNYGDPNYEVVEELKLKLEDPNVATEVKFGGRTYFAFSKFKDGSGGPNSFNSQCDRTFPGWHSDSKDPDSSSWGCFHATKSSSSSTGAETEADNALLELGGARGGSTQKLHISKHGMSPRDGAHVRLTTYRPHTAYLHEVNASAGARWQTAKYSSELRGMSLLSLHQRMGSAQVKAGQHHLLLSTADQRETDYSSLLRALNDAGLPKNLDWRNKDGKNYVDKVISQICGSCYAASTISMINSRLRIASGLADKTDYNYKQVLDCDQYNQGCAGGYPFLVEKYIHDFGMTKNGQCAAGTPQMLLEQTAKRPYVNTNRKHRRLGGSLLAKLSEEEEDEGGRSETTSADLRVADWNYIGGYYGGSRPVDIIKELAANGPVTVGIGGSLELMHYKSGVFHHTNTETPIYSWAPVSHAVVVVGYETDQDNKMNWIIKNSYGSGWGEAGYFRIGVSQDPEGDRNINTLVTWATPTTGGGL